VKQNTETHVQRSSPRPEQPEQAPQLVVDMTVALTLLPLPGLYTISRLPPEDPLPRWADGPGFVSISRTADELSVVCPEERVPAGVLGEAKWRCLKFVGPFAFDQAGIAVAVLAPLAAAGIGIFLISTFDTDYLLLKEADYQRAADVIEAAGHRLAPEAHP
jgi:hypothetical protein